MSATDCSVNTIARRQRAIAQPPESLGTPRTLQLRSVEATASGVAPNDLANWRTDRRKALRVLTPPSIEDIRSLAPIPIVLMPIVSSLPRDKCVITMRPGEFFRPTGIKLRPGPSPSRSAIVALPVVPVRRRTLTTTVCASAGPARAATRGRCRALWERGPRSAPRAVLSP
jgi:hypothetical protein